MRRRSSTATGEKPAAPATLLRDAVCDCGGRLDRPSTGPTGFHFPRSPIPTSWDDEEKARHRMQHQYEWSVALLRNCTTCGRGYFVATEAMTIRRRDGSTRTLVKGEVSPADPIYGTDPEPPESQQPLHYGRFRAHLIHLLVTSPGNLPKVTALLRKAATEPIDIPDEEEGTRTVGPFPTKAERLFADAVTIEADAAERADRDAKAAAKAATKAAIRAQRHGATPAHSAEPGQAKPERLDP